MAEFRSMDQPVELWNQHRSDWRIPNPCLQNTVIKSIKRRLIGQEQEKKKKKMIMNEWMNEEQHDKKKDAEQEEEPHKEPEESGACLWLSVLSIYLFYPSVLLTVSCTAS